MRVTAMLLAALVGTASPETVAQERFSLEQVMSSPFPTSLTTGPDGTLVAWVQNDRGERNIWVATSPGFSGRPATRFTGDDGQEITDVTVVPGNQRLVFVRGGDPNRAGEIPNPTSDTDAARRTIMRLDLSDSAVVELAEGADPAVSPDGSTVAFIRDGTVWTVPVAGGEPTTLLHMRGRASSVTWSPDGARLAIVSDRGDHGFIAIFSVASDDLRYLHPSMDHDAHPTWSPDGQRIAFIREPNVRSALPFAPRRSGHPWSIHIANVVSGESRRIWTADAGDGSVFQGIEGQRQLLWAEGDRIIFPWEKTGWKNLYAVAARGGEPLALALGPFEVEEARLSLDRRQVVYSSNANDPHRRHLWEVDVAGGAPRRLMEGFAIEWAPVPVIDGVAYLGSGATTPAHARVMTRAGSMPMVQEPVPPGFPSEHLVVPRTVAITATDGMEIPAQLFVPSQVVPGGQYPAVIFFHGGSRRQMLLGFHYLGYYHNTYAFNQYLANRGYIVLSVNYRSGIGYGMEFREALDYGARGASEFHDVIGAALFLRNRPEVDPDRIGLWGGSYGGYLTALGLARASDLFAAGVDVHGVHDWNMVIRNFVPSYDPAERPDVAQLAFSSSPLAWVDGWRSPVLLIHGDDDRNVPFSESVDLAEALRARGVEFEQLIFPDEVHGFLLHRNWIAAFEAAAAFLDRHLGGGRDLR